MLPPNFLPALSWRARLSSRRSSLIISPRFFIVLLQPRKAWWLSMIARRDMLTSTKQAWSLCVRARRHASSATVYFRPSSGLSPLHCLPQQAEPVHHRHVPVIIANPCADEIKYFEVCRIRPETEVSAPLQASPPACLPTALADRRRTPPAWR